MSRPCLPSLAVRFLASGLASLLTLAGGGPATARADGRFGIEGVFSPIGTWSSTATLGGTDFGISGDLEVSGGVGAFLDFKLGPYFSLGFVPEVLFNVKPTQAVFGIGTGTELDLQARATGWLPTSRGIDVYGYLAPGYSVVFLSDKPPGQNNLQGIVLGIGGGVAIHVGRRGFVPIEARYNFGFQTESPNNGNDFDFHLRSFQLMAGIGTTF
jgi:hypothetical protein